MRHIAAKTEIRHWTDRYIGFSSVNKAFTPLFAGVAFCRQYVQTT